MALSSLALLIAAAALHTGWNLVLKRASQRYLVTWWALVVGSVGLLPFAVAAYPFAPAIWPYVLGSAVFQAAYFALLALAYTTADFSLVYPIARGGAPALLALWATLFLREAPHGAGLFGIGLVVVGLLVVGSGGWLRARGTAAPELRSVALALLIAVCISGYSVIDGAAVRRMAPGGYLALSLAATALLYAPAIVARHGWRAAGDAWRCEWRRIVVVGALTALAYLLVLAAYARTPVSYAGAVREISIVFAALAGWRWLGERFGGVRLAGSLLIFGGILVIAVAA